MPKGGQVVEPIENSITLAKSFRGVEPPVLVSRNDGPPIFVLHEIFGMSKSVAAFAEMIRQAGFRVYMSVLYGRATSLASWSRRCREHHGPEHLPCDRPEPRARRLRCGQGHLQRRRSAAVVVVDIVHYARFWMTNGYNPR